MRNVVMAVLMVCLFLGGRAAMAASETGLLLGVNEGLAEQSQFLAMQDRYKGLADYISQVLKRPVKVESSQNLRSSASNLKKSRYDLMFCRPSNVTARAIRDDHYNLVAMAKGAFTAAFIVNKDSPLKTIEDIRGKRLAMPAQTALMTKMGLATLRDLKIDPAKEHITYAHYQDALTYEVKNHFADAAVVAPIVVKDWEKEGGRVLYQSKKAPFWAVIAAPTISADDVAKLRDALINLENTEDGKKILAKIGVKGFVPGNQQDYLDLLKWIDE